MNVQHSTFNLFADTLIEDADLYRFNQDVESYLGFPITRIAEGRTPWQVFRDEGMIGNTLADICSRILKREFLWEWISRNFKPNECIVHLGMDWEEWDRLVKVRAAKPEWTIDAPMMAAPAWNKCQMLEELRRIKIEQPKLYTFGFPHNNCGGFCIKAGISHFVHLLKVLPLVYIMHEEEELLTQQIFKERHIGDGNYTILRDRRGGVTKPLSLRELRLRVEAGEEFPTDEWGGCGCSVDFKLN